MIRIEPHEQRRSARLAGIWAVCVLSAVLVVGCGDSDDGPPNTPVPTATATQAAATTTATAVRTATPTATSQPPTATATVPVTSTPTTPPNPDAMAACAKLAGCNQCFTSFNGQCIAPEACAQRVGSDAAICINSRVGCDATALGDCLFLGCDGNDAGGESQ